MNGGSSWQGILVVAVLGALTGAVGALGLGPTPGRDLVWAVGPEGRALSECVLNSSQSPEVPSPGPISPSE